MTDAELVLKKLAFIETCLRDLRTESRPERLADDIRERRFVEHSLQLAIQAAIDVGSHIVSDERLGEPATNRALFGALVKGKWIDTALGQRLADMAGFRNVLVHGYVEVDLDIVRGVLQNRLIDLDDFVRIIRSRIAD
jgi:uncharacterized protein YutE (UPF0331/DUF86 family)